MGGEFTYQPKGLMPNRFDRPTLSQVLLIVEIVFSILFVQLVTSHVVENPDTLETELLLLKFPSVTGGGVFLVFVSFLKRSLTFRCFLALQVSLLVGSGAFFFLFSSRWVSKRIFSWAVVVKAVLGSIMLVGR